MHRAWLLWGLHIQGSSLAKAARPRDLASWQASARAPGASPEGDGSIVLLSCRSLLTQEGVCLTLQPNFHFLEVAYPYVARRLLTDEDPTLRERLFQVRLCPLESTGC